MAMIRPETQDRQLLRATANLLASVAEAAWTNDIPSPAKWDLHRIGTEAYLAQRDILDVLGLPAVMAEPQADFDIAVSLEQAARTLAAIPRKVRNLDTERLEARVSSLARWAVALASGPIPTRR